MESFPNLNCQSNKEIQENYKILPNSPLQEMKENKKPRKLGPLEKSLLFPGWGQISQKKYAKGIVFASAEGVCLGAVIFYAIKGSNSYSRYKTANNINDVIRYRCLTEDYDKRRITFLALGAIVWAANLIDIYINHSNKEKKEQQFLKINNKCGIDINMKYINSIGISFYVKF